MKTQRVRGTHIQKLYTLSTCKLLTHSKKSSGYQFGLLVFLLISRSLPGLLCVHACKHRSYARSKSTDSSLFLHVARFYENRRSILTNQNTGTFKPVWIHCMISMCDNLEKWTLKFVRILSMTFSNEDSWLSIWCDISYFSSPDTFVAEITFLADHDKSILKLDLLKKKKTLGKKITRSKSSIKLSTTMWISSILSFKHPIKAARFN